MIETQFKVLMHTGQYVEPDLLEKGIYSTSRPTLYSKDTTIELLIEHANLMRDITGELFVTNKYFDNLKKCELVLVRLNVLNK